ncbi:MAG: hypothetical protein C0491_13320 [Novosphingobium sp.]|nr:hypothetical protein [Novosphingobium sp.]
MGPGLRRGDGGLGGFLVLLLFGEQRGEAGFGFGGAGGPGLAGEYGGLRDVALVGFVPVVPGLVGFVVGGIGAGALEVLFRFAGAAGEEAFARRVGEAGGGGGVLPRGEREEHVVEVLGEVVDGLRSLRGAGVEPCEMGEQEPRVEALALAHRLAPEPDRLGGAMERALGKDLLGRLARMEQRSVPRGSKGRIAATADIGRLL